MIHPKKALDARRLRPKKSLGQVFLTDPATLARIADAVEAGPGDTVMEIGCGTGLLTRELAARAGFVTGVEVDFDLFDVCEEATADLDNVEIVLGSVLDTKPKTIAERAGGKILVCGNLPYYLSTEIAFFLLSHHESISRMALMFQKEVGERIAAPPGGKQVGVTSMLLQYRFSIERLFAVPAGRFYPKPDVDSVVLRMDTIEGPDPAAVDEKLFARLVKTAFVQRRKTLRNALKPAGLSPEQLAGVLDEAGIDGARRPETLSVAEWVALSNAWTGRTG